MEGDIPVYVKTATVLIEESQLLSIRAGKDA
jgi:hypothetical protein